MVLLQRIKHIAIATAVLIIVLWISSIQYDRIDVTGDKRYTLNPSTVTFLEELQDTIRFSVYLHGELPLAFAKMKREVNDMLNEYKRIGGAHVQILFIDPASLSKGKNSIQNTYKRLMQYGLKPYTIQEEDEQGKLVQRYILPGIIVSTSQKYVPINLLANALGNSTEEQIYNALQQLEYQCIKSMKQLTAKKRKNIAFLTDHKELDFQYVFDATMLLMEQYNVDRISTQQLFDSITKYDVVILAKPRTALSEAHKYILDQFVMHGGNLLIATDNVGVNIDSLQIRSHTTAYPLQLNSSDLFFNFGFRINNTIVLDNQCATIPFNISPLGMPPRFEPAPWYYYPLLKPLRNSHHPITHAIDVVKAEFASSLDTLEGNGTIQKHILLASSAYSRTIGVPNPVGFSILDNVPDKTFFNTYYLPIAVLFEGSYNSLYKNRTAPIDTELIPKQFSPLYSSDSTKIIVISDGDIFKNEIEIRENDTIPKPMHYYKYFAVDKRIYTGNKDFFLNSVNYLCGDQELLNIRSRELKIRLLNKTRVVNERTYWQILNIAAPILILIIIAGVVLFIRKQKFGKKYVG